jgi:F-type H+-transporting ATPase subunit b
MKIDWWTLGLQTVNVVVLMWLLKRFFWGPVAGMIAQRRALSQKDLADARIDRDKAAAGLADIARTRAGFAAERDVILAAARAESAKASAADSAEAAKAAAALAVAAKAEIEKQRDQAAKAWTERSSSLAVDIATRLAGRLDGPAVHGAFLEWALKAIRALPESARQSVAAQTGAVEAVSATPLDPAEQERTTKLIGQAFGGPSSAPRDLVFKTDPSLVAGLELRADHLVVSNSWRADLTQILAEIANDQRH